MTSRRTFRIVIAALLLLALAFVFLMWRNAAPTRSAGAQSAAPASPSQQIAATPSPQPGPTAATGAPGGAGARRELPNIDRRVMPIGEAPNRAVLEDARARRVQAADQLKASVPGARVDFDETLGAPKYIGSTGGFLASLGAGQAGAVSGGEAQQLVKTFVDQQAALFGHTSAVFTGTRLVRDYETPHNGMRTMVWQQELDGIRVFESTMQANVSKSGELINVSSRLVPDPAAAVENRAAIVANPAIDAKAAISAAAAGIGETVVPAQIIENAPADGAAQKQEFRAARLLGVSSQYVWVPLDEATLRLSWEVLLTSKQRGEMYRTLIDATTGETLVRQRLTEYISPASYRVFTGDSPTPLSPGPATPGTTQPPEVVRTLVTLEGLDTTASPNGWINDGINETLGNNVDAHLDLNADNIADTPRPQGSPNRVFDFALDLTQAPGTYGNAAVTNLFYWNNFIHDRFYQLGFTEAAGNFQNDNFGRGGSGNDAVQADAQDGSGTNNANFSTPPDGSPGRMQMYVFTGPAPDRDGDFDQEIVIHEYTHGLSNRLVGGGVGISSLQPRGMGEGWSDFYALCLLSAPADDPNGVYAAGAYATYQLSGLTQNYYYGIRRYPYCTDLTKNPLTFKDIDSAQASAHTGIPRSPIIGNTATEVHNMGEVWCVTLWDARANLIAKHGAAAGNELILQLVTDGMKLAPANPTFLQARDGIIQADLVNNGGANRGELWLAFAKRGMGSAATSPASSTTTGLVENYDVPDDLGVGPTAAWNVTATVGGPFTATQTYTLVNSGTTPLDWTTAKTQPWLALPSAGGTLAPGATTTVTASLTADANSLVAGSYADTITFTNTTSGFAQSRAVALAIEPLTVPILSETWESGAAGSAWSITGTNTHRTLVTTANAPHGGSYHLTMDSSVDGTLARNEATWTANLAGRSNVQLRFWVKMFNDEANGPPASPFVGGADFDGVAISADGTNWYEVQPLRTLVSTWTRYTVDLDAAIAARGLSYNSTFRIRFNHFDDFGISTDGFAFDDIELVELVNNRLSVTLPSNANEGSGVLTGTVAVMPTPSSDLTITLASSQPAQASVPASVVVVAGQSSATFPVTLVDDALLDGTQAVIITATSPAYVNGSATLAVEDNETATLSLSLPTTVGEAAGTIVGTLTISAAPGTDVPVTLASSNPSEIAPITATIPAGQTSVNFVLPIIDDTRLDGSIVTTITAQVANWTPGTANITVTDNENAVLVVSLPATAREGDGSASGSVQIAGTLPTPLTVALTSSDTSELTVPASVTIPAGQTSVSFTATILDDPDADGAQDATVTASAAGLGDGADTISVRDNDAHHFTLGAVASSQVPNAPFTITVSARDVNDAPITNFNSPVALTAAGDGGPLAVSPATLSGWVNGVWAGNISMAASGTNVVLTADDSQGHTGVSNAFNLAVGPLHHFGWAPIPSPQVRDNFFPVTIAAQDAGNNTVTAFSGTTSLTVAQTGGVQILSWTGYADTSASGEYQNTKQAISTYFPSYTETNTAVTDPAQLAAALAGKHVFLIPEQESVATGTMGALGTAWASVLTSFVNGGGIVIVCSWSGDEHQLLVNSGLMTVTKGAAPSSASVTKTADTVLNAGVATPFAGSYISDYSGSNGIVSLHTTAGNPVVLSRAVGSGQSILIGTDFYTLGTGMDRIVANAVAQANATGAVIPILPATSGSFVNGVWSGNVAVPFSGSSVKLRADDGAGHTGDSNAFMVQAPAPPPGPSGTIFSEPFEDATLGSWWTITGTGPYRTLLTTANTPHGGSKHLTMDSSTDGTYARNEATLSVNLAGRSGVVLSFWVKGFGDEANGPPPSPFTGGYDFDGVAISADGVNWYEVQALRTLSSVYGQFTVDLDAAITTRGLSYNSNFKIRFNQYDNFTISTDGIAIDDILITSAQTPNVTVAVPAQVAENAGTITGTVSFGSAQAADTSVALISNANARVAVPASVTVPAGQASANFTLTVLDNTLLDGNRTVGIIATPPDNIPASASILVVDDETTSLTFNAPASATEGDAALTGTLTLGAMPSGPITLSLTSSDTSEITVPATISFAAGQTSATFPITIVDDSQIDGSQTATITVGASGWTDATASITVADNENSALTVNLAASTSEGAGSLAGTIAISGTIPTDLVVALSSSDTSEVTVPATITIPAGQTSAAFTATIVDDSDLDGTQTATITASAPNFTGASQTVTVIDDDAHHFDISAVPSPQLRGAAFPLTITAKDVNGVTVSAFGAATTLSASAGGNPVAVTPGNLTGFVNGVWTGPVSITQLASGIVLTATAGAATGSSNAFSVLGSDYDDPDNWATFGNGPAHTGYQPLALGTAVYQAGWTKSFPPSTNGWTGLNQVAISNGQVFVTPLTYFDSTYLSALNATTGVELWRKSFVNSFSINPPTVNAGRVYVQKGKSTSPGNDAQLWCIGAVSGASVWMAPFGAQWGRYFAPLVVGEGVWVNGGTTGGLYGFNSGNGSQRFFNSSLAQYDQWTPTYDNGTIYTWVAGVFRAHDPMTGTILWSSTLSTGTPYSANTVPAIALSKAFVIGNPNLFAIDLPTRTTAWTVSGTFKGSPSVANGTVFALSGGDVKAYNSQTGALLGTYSTGNTAITGQPIVTNDTLIVAAPTNTYIFNLATFTLRQTLPSGGVASLANGVLYLAGTDNVLRTFRPTGQNAITVSLPVSSANEGSPALTGIVSLAQPPASDTLVTLKNGGSNRVNLPASVTIPAGQTSATFLLTIMDDTLLNGSEVVPVTASGPSHLFLKGFAGLTVHDNETAAISLSVPASTAEGAASVTGTVTLSVAPGANITVNLASNDTTEATVPESVTVPAGQTTATFTVTPINDTEIDGTQTVTIAASVTGWTSGSGSIAVADNENRNFTLYGPYSVSEGQTSTGTVYISGTLPTALTVTLTSSNPAQYSVPASVTIPAGQTSASFTGTAVEDTTTDGTQTVTITASAATFVSASATPSAYDNDVHHFAFSSAIAGAQIANKPFSATLEARDINDVRINTYNGTLNLTGASTGGAVTVAPATVTLSSGYWSGNLAITSPATGVTIAATAGLITGVSNSFTVGLGTLDHLTWSTIGSPQTVGVPFNATVTAKDAYENTLPSANGSAALSAGAPSRVTGSGTGDYAFLFELASQERNQAIYQPAEVGPAGRINKLAIQANVYTGGTVSNCTVRMKHTTLASYGTSPVWESTGWTTVYQGSLTLSGSGAVWVEVPLSTPFQYDGTSNLMVDISHNSASSVHAHSTATNKSNTRALYYTGSGFTDPLLWSGASSPTPYASTFQPNLRLGFEGTLPVVPASVTLANGVWTGPVTVNQVAANIALKAMMASGTAGESNTFSVIGGSNLKVTPAGWLSATGKFGGPFTPASATYTLTNTGSVPLNWTAARTAAWLNLSATSGTLAVGASTTVTVTIAATTIAPGNYTDTITFTNLSGGFGNTTRQVALNVTLAAPTLVAEPPVTGGTDNTVSWNAVAGADSYELQAATNAAFTSPLNSGPVVGTSHTFTGLSDGQIYYYRARARRAAPGASSAWTQTTQAEFATGSMANAGATAAGSVTLTGEVTGRISNPSFENGPANWAQASTATVGGGSINYTSETPMPTQGSYFYYLYTHTTYTHAPGEYGRISQSVDLTNLTALKFDARLQPTSSGNNAYRAEVRIDGVTRWAVTAWGDYLDQSIDLTGLTGIHTIELRGEVVASFSGSHWVEFDNLRTFGMSGPYAASGTLTSPVINPSPWSHWNQLSFTKDASAIGTALSIDVLDAGGTLLAANVPSGADLNAIPAIASQPSIRLRANLSTTNPANTPRLDDWSVSWQAAPDTLATSAWSNVVTSTQDAAFADLDGDGLPDAWETLHGLDTADDTGLHGALGDLDSDGLPNIFEYLANLNPGVSDATSAYWTTVETKPEDGLKYLVFHHRQRTGLFNWTVSLETSTNATTWDGAASLYEEASLPTLLPDGLTRIHHHRVLHPVEGAGAGRAFVRLRATAQ